MLIVLPRVEKKPRYFDVLCPKEGIRAVLHRKYIVNKFDYCGRMEYPYTIFILRNYKFEYKIIEAKRRKKIMAKTIIFVKPNSRFKFRKYAPKTALKYIRKYLDGCIINIGRECRVYELLYWLQSKKPYQKTIYPLIFSEFITRYYILQQKRITFDINQIVNSYIAIDNIIVTFKANFIRKE